MNSPTLLLRLSGNTAIHYTTTQHYTTQHYTTLYYNTTQHTTIHYTTTLQFTYETPSSFLREYRTFTYETRASFIGNTAHRKGGGVGEPLVPPIDSTKLYSNQIISIQLYIYQPISHLMSRRMD